MSDSDLQVIFNFSIGQENLKSYYTGISCYISERWPALYFTHWRM